MKNKKEILFWVLLYILFNTKQLEAKYAFVIKPVIDLIGQEAHDTADYSTSPLSPVNKKNVKACPRIHQLIFNETVKIIKEGKDQVLVEVPHVFYETNNNLNRINTFWTLKENLILINKDRDIIKLPKPICFKNSNTSDYQNQNIITLKYPFLDPVTQKKYSAGTRFVYIPDSSGSIDQFAVYIFNPDSTEYELSAIPAKLCVLNNSLNKEEQISNFVLLLKKWANLKGFIPYVWGGCSFIHLCKEDDYFETQKVSPNNNLDYYKIPGCNFVPKSGFDCAGMIVRAAQICSIPFFFKNTTTIAKNLNTLTQEDEISAGDLIWIPGHIIAITDCKKNLCVEARDYSQGYGKVQELPLYKLFKNINTVHDLKKALLDNRPLERLNNKGNVIQIITNFKVLKLDSVPFWNTHNNHTPKIYTESE